MPEAPASCAALYSLSVFMKQLVIATRNSGKLREFRELLLPLKTEILSLADLRVDEEFEESGNTFAENARLKAIGYSRIIQLPVLGG